MRLELIILVLILLWALGAFVVPIGGSAIHALFVLAVVVLVLRLVQERDV